MVVTIIVECPRCGGLLLSLIDKKTKGCPYCGVRIEIFKAKHIASADNALDASTLLKKIKSQRQSNARNHA